jgi:hypothetical protein
MLCYDSIIFLSLGLKIKNVDIIICKIVNILYP